MPPVHCTTHVLLLRTCSCAECSASQFCLGYHGHTVLFVLFITKHECMYVQPEALWRSITCLGFAGTRARARKGVPAAAAASPIKAGASSAVAEHSPVAEAVHNVHTPNTKVGTRQGTGLYNLFMR